MQLGQTIVKIRKEHELTQEDFAKKFNVTRQTVSNWENEKSYPDLLTLVKISDEFGYSLDTMLKENPDMTKDMNKDMQLGKTLTKIYEKELVIASVSAVACLIMFVISLVNNNGMAWIWLIAMFINVNTIGTYVRINKAGTEERGEYVQLADKMYIIDIDKKKLPAFDLFEYDMFQGNKMGKATLVSRNAKQNEKVKVPTCVLYGITKGFFGMKRTRLGFYATLEDVQKELDNIAEAGRHNMYYELKYAAKMQGVCIATDEEQE